MAVLTENVVAGPEVVAFERDYARRRAAARRGQAVFAVVFVAAYTVATVMTDFTPQRIVDGMPKLGDFIVKTVPEIRLATLWADIGFWFAPWRFWLGLLIETVLIAFLATTIGVIGGFLLSFPAARNLAPNVYVNWLSRRWLEIARTVPELVWALIFVFSFGVGPIAGVLAIGLHATGALGKLYSEVNENIDMKPVEGLRAAGASWPQMIRYAVVPQVIPNILSYTLLRFEINVRASSIIGYVGAGGLGGELRQVISFQEYSSISALFLMVLLTVIVIDFSCEKVRHRFIGAMGRVAG